MDCAPILVTTLCRDKHFIRLIESLKKNTWAENTEIYVGLDFPSKKEHYDGYNRILSYLKGDFAEFKGFHVIQRKKNYGSLRNMTELREYVLQSYDCFIRTDDDAEFSPNFIKYMNVCLEKYKYDKEVLAVVGYSYPVNWNVSETSTVFKQNFICPVWGVGFWKDKYNEMYRRIVTDKELKKIAKQVIAGNAFKRMMRTSQSEYVDLCLSPDFDTTLAAVVSDISINMYMAINDMFVIMPVRSKVRNWGFDGSGEYCSSYQGNSRTSRFTAYNYPYDSQQIDCDVDFHIVEDSMWAINRNRRLFNTFDVLPLKTRILSSCKLWIYRIFGEYTYYRMILFIRKIKRHRI